MGARRECQGGAANRVRGQGAEGREGAGSSQALEGGNGQGEREQKPRAGKNQGLLSHQLGRESLG